MDLQIRLATERDEGNVYTFLCELEEVRLDPTAFRAIFLHNLADPNVQYLVAESDGLPVGFISCHVQHLLHHTGKVAEIQEFFVLPPYRGRGIGKKLVTATEAFVRRSNAVHLEVTTNQRRTATVGFYQRAGFTLSHFKLVKTL